MHSIARSIRSAVTPLGLLALLVGCTAQAADGGAMAVQPRGKVFTTSDGAKLEIAFLAPAGTKQALVRVTGTTNPHDGEVYLTDVREWDSNADYSFQIPGGKKPKTYVLVTVRRGQYDAYLPDDQRTLSFRYDDKKSEAFAPDSLREAFAAQKKK